MGNCIGLSSEPAGVLNDSFVDALFFPDKSMPCKGHHWEGGCKRKKCRFSHEDTSLVKFLRYLRQAKKTLDICVFTITCDEIANEVLDAYKRGVKVRVITDDDQQKSLGSDIHKFIDAGIPVLHELTCITSSV